MWGWLPTLISFMTAGNCFICQAHHQACLENIRVIIRLDMRTFHLACKAKGTHNDKEGIKKLDMRVASIK